MGETAIDRKTFEKFSPARQQEILSTMTTAEAINLGLVDDPQAILSPEPVKHRVPRVAPAVPGVSPWPQRIADATCFVVLLVGYAFYGTGVVLSVSADLCKNAGRWLLARARERS